MAELKNWKKTKLKALQLEDMVENKMLDIL